MKGLVIASNNRHKIFEISAILGERLGRIYSLADLGIVCEPEETGETFFENALIKAKAAAEAAGMPALADDSGLTVYALGGAPGVFSARYAGEPSNDAKNNALLLDSMSGLEDRRAAFVSCVVMYDPQNPKGTVFAEGRLEGEILREYRGTGGFGYDPLFYIPQLGKSMAELTAEEKNMVSHRAKALDAFKEQITFLK